MAIIIVRYGLQNVKRISGPNFGFWLTTEKNANSLKLFQNFSFGTAFLNKAVYAAGPISAILVL
jgi:hypothetical protein